MDLETYHTIRVACCDLNGQMRGKRVPSSYAGKLETGAARMPISALSVDIFGADVEASPLVFATGDADGVMRPTDRGPVPLPWLEVAQPLVPMGMYHEDGRAFEGDPRHCLALILQRFAARGLRVVAATELEFTLVDDRGTELRTVINPRSGRRPHGPEILSMSEMDAFDPFLSGLYAACAEMGIQAQATTCESGLGQFEITLTHQDAMRAADDTWLFKSLIRGMARKHDLTATFMAKPFPEDAGNGLHMHFSILDEAGHNVFDNGTDAGSELLQFAVAGCLNAMPGATLIFAPHANSYDRMVPGAHAPTGVCWAYENRTAAIRIPGGSHAARRIEHRVSGGDTNPYLVFAAVLGAALTGIEDAAPPPAPITGNAYDLDLPQLAPDWQSAIDLFDSDPWISRILPKELIRNLVLTKKQELSVMETIPNDKRWETYLETV